MSDEGFRRTTLDPDASHEERLAAQLRAGMVAEALKSLSRQEALAALDGVETRHMLEALANRRYPASHASQCLKLSIDAGFAPEQGTWLLVKSQVNTVLSPLV